MGMLPSIPPALDKREKVIGCDHPPDLAQAAVAWLPDRAVVWAPDL